MVSRKRKPVMKVKKEDDKKTVATRRSAQVRATISFPPDLYESLEDVARQKKVSLAWVVRDATEKYIADRWPLFRQQ